MHWTYEKIQPDSDLCQGDILEPTEELGNLFKKIHPHFTQPKYLGFFVLTQSCDLSRRKEKGNKCSATHICLSVIRSLQDVIRDSLKNHFGFLAPGVYAQHMKRTVEMMVERLMNQNENTLGLFYLYPNVDAGITLHSVAILRVAISVKAIENYETLVRARVGRLSKEFQPKLGWMVGNLYSRVGVRDWKEEKEGEEEKIIKEILCFTREEPIWLDSRLYKKIIKEYPDFNNFSSTEQTKIIKNSSPTPPKEKAIEIIAKTVKQVSPRIPEDALEKIKNRLINDEQFEAQMKKFGKYT
jgi:hypothetical protein